MEQQQHSITMTTSSSSNSSSSGWHTIEAKGSAPLPRGGHSAVWVEGKLYVFGGSAYSLRNNKVESAAQVQEDLHVFEVQTTSWTRLTPSGTTLPTPRYAHSATAVGKKIVIFGGFNGQSYLDDIFVLDTVSLTWFQSPPQGKIPAARYAHSTTLVGGRLFVFGGCGEKNVFNELLILDLGRNMTWQTPAVGGTHPPARAYHTASLVGNRLFVFGGRAGNRYFNDVHVLIIGDILTWDKVHTFGSPPSARAYHTSVAVGSKILFFGGMDGVKCFNEVFVLDTANMNWSQVSFPGKPPSPRHKHTASLLGTRIWFFGGMEAPPNGYNDLHMLALTGKEIKSNAAKDIQPVEMDIGSIQAENIQLREKLEWCHERIQFLSGKNLDKLSLNEMEELETLYFGGLQRLSLAKKQKIIDKCKEDWEKQREYLGSEYIRNKPASNLGNINQVEQLQETVTVLQNENLKLRKRMKENGIELMEGIQKSFSVGFSSVTTREFLPSQGEGAVPSEGGAPLGMSLLPIRENLESIAAFEERREVERKGVLKIPENERIQILKSQGVSDDVINEEARNLDTLNWHRLQSISSPTENPLPDSKREQYRRILYQT